MKRRRSGVLKMMAAEGAWAAAEWAAAIAQPDEMAEDLVGKTAGTGLIKYEGPVVPKRSPINGEST